MDRATRADAIAKGQAGLGEGPVGQHGLGDGHLAVAPVRRVGHGHQAPAKRATGM